MAKSKLVKDQDKVIIRLPDGLRDRVKEAAARHGVSMNEEIVNLLRNEYPARSLDARLEELSGLATVLRKAGASPALDSLLEGLRQLAWDIANGVVPVEGNTQDDVHEAVFELEESEANELAGTRPLAGGRE